MKRNPFTRSEYFYDCRDSYTAIYEFKTFRKNRHTTTNTTTTTTNTTSQPQLQPQPRHCFAQVLFFKYKQELMELEHRKPRETETKI